MRESLRPPKKSVFVGKRKKKEKGEKKSVFEKSEKKGKWCGVVLLLCVVEFKALVSVRVVVKEKVMSWELGGIVSEVCVLDVVAEGSVEPGPKKSCLSAESAVVEPDHHGCERQGLEGVVGVEHVCPAGVGFVTQTEHHAKETDAESEDCACLGDSCCALCSPAFHKLRNHAVQCRKWFDDVCVC